MKWRKERWCYIEIERRVCR